MFVKSAASNSCTVGCSIALLRLRVRFLAGGTFEAGFILEGPRLSFSSSCFLRQGFLKSPSEIILGLKLWSHGGEGCSRRSKH